MLGQRKLGLFHERDFKKNMLVAVMHLRRWISSGSDRLWMSNVSGRAPLGRAVTYISDKMEAGGVSGSMGGTVLQAGPAHPTRLDRFLAESRPGVPFSFVQKLIRMRKVRIQSGDGVWVREKDSARRLKAGELVRVHSQFFAEGITPVVNGSSHLLPTRDIQRVRDGILFEDEDCIVINKVLPPSLFFVSRHPNTHIHILQFSMLLVCFVHPCASWYLSLARYMHEYTHHACHHICMQQQIHTSARPKSCLLLTSLW